MNATDYWSLFLETGAPEVYLLYNKVKKSEAHNVFIDTGTCPAGHDIQ